MAEGSQAQLSYGLELAEGIPGGTEVFTRFTSEDLMLDRPLTTNPNIDPSGEMTQPYNLAADGSGKKLSGVPDVVSELRLAIHYNEWYAYTSPVGGVDQYVTRKKLTADSAVTDYLNSLYLKVYRDDDNPSRLTGGKIVDRTINIAERQFIGCDRSLMLLRDTFLGDPEVSVADAAYAGVVIVDGHSGTPEAGDVYKVKVTTGGALDGTARVKFTKNLVAYGSTSYPVVNGQRIKVLLADGTDPGVRSEREHIYVTFWSDTPGDVLTVNSEWTIDPVREVAAPTYSTCQPLTGVDAEASVTLNGVTKTYPIHSLKIGLKRTGLKLNTGIGSKYAFGVINRGERAYEYTIAREYTDLDFYRALYLGQPCSIDVPITGSRIGSTDYNELWHLELLYGRVGNAGANVANKGSLPESITVSGYNAGPGLVTHRETFIVPGVSSL